MAIAAARFPRVLANGRVPPGEIRRWPSNSIEQEDVSLKVSGFIAVLAKSFYTLEISNNTDKNIFGPFTELLQLIM